MSSSKASTSAQFDPLSGYTHPTDHHSSHPSTSANPSLAPMRSNQSKSSDDGSRDRRSDATLGAKSVGGGAKASRNSTSTSGRRRVATEEEPFLRTPLIADLRLRRVSVAAPHYQSPPRDPTLFDTDEEWKQFHEEEPDSWPHYIPLILVALPPLGAIIHGPEIVRADDTLHNRRAENWSDGIILLLIVFYLYQLVKVPWSIYRASHTRYVLAGTTRQPSSEIEGSPAEKRRLNAIRILRRNELLALSATAAVPAVGSYLLHFVKDILSDPDRYINQRIITLFALATSVKPLLHFAKLAKNSSLYYQEAVHYPSTEVHLLRLQVEALQKDISQLARAFATKDDVRLLRDGVDVPLSQLSKAVRRFDRKEEYLRLSSEERFALVDARLEEAQRETAMNAELLEVLREDHERYSHPITAALHVIGAVLGSQVRGNKVGGKREYRWFQKGPFWLLLWPVNVSSLAIEWVQNAKTDLVGHEDTKASLKGSHSSPGQVTMSA
ncbi:hypothetical protein P7C70_g8019, partial [Phenoliferia sp. Uapishka_3]